MGIPPDLMRVQGCSCTGGGRWHESTCDLFKHPVEQRNALIKEASRRITDRSTRVLADLNAAMKPHMPEGVEFAWGEPE